MIVRECWCVVLLYLDVMGARHRRVTGLSFVLCWMPELVLLRFGRLVCRCWCVDGCGIWYEGASKIFRTDAVKIVNLTTKRV
jgi:hypothetical protein